MTLTNDNSQEAARDAQRGTLLLSNKHSIERHDTFMARFQALERALLVSYTFRSIPLFLEIPY